MPRETLNPDSLFDSTPYGFSQIAIGCGTKLVTLSGQVALDKDLKLIGDSLAVQAIQALENVKNAMIALDGSLDDIVSIRFYVVESSMQEPGVSEAMRKFFPVRPPTMTWVGITSLARPEYLVEIEVMAVLD